MAAGESGFDPLPAIMKPVEGVVEIVLAGIGDGEVLGESGVVPQTGGGERGGGVNEALDDPGDDEIALARRLGVDEALELETADVGVNEDRRAGAPRSGWWQEQCGGRRGQTAQKSDQSETFVGGPKTSVP